MTETFRAAPWTPTVTGAATCSSASDAVSDPKLQSGGVCASADRTTSLETSGAESVPQCALKKQEVNQKCAFLLAVE